MPIIFDDGFSNKYEKKHNLIMYPKIKIDKKNLFLDFLIEGNGKPQKQKILLRYPQNLKMKINNLSEIFYQKK